MTNKLAPMTTHYCPIPTTSLTWYVVPFVINQVSHFPLLKYFTYIARFNYLIPNPFSFLSFDHQFLSQNPVVTSSLRNLSLRTVYQHVTTISGMFLNYLPIITNLWSISFSNVYNPLYSQINSRK